MRKMQERQKTARITREPGSDIVGQENCLHLHYAKIKTIIYFGGLCEKILNCTSIFPFKMLKWNKTWLQPESVVWQVNVHAM